MILAIIIEIAVLLPLLAFHLSFFLIVSITVMVGNASWLLGYQRLSRRHGWASLQERFSRVNGRIIITSVLAGLFLAPLPWGLAQILTLWGIETSVITAQSALPNNLQQLPVAMAGLVVLGPLAEELIFRGMLLDWLRQRIAVWPAALVISLLFALLHDLRFKKEIIDWIAFVVRFLLGMGTSIFAIKYRSLRPSFVMHATLNACACLSNIVNAAA